MPSFLVETYTPGPGRTALRGLAAQAEEAANVASTAGIAIQHVRSFLAPDDEVCFHLFEATSADAVVQMSELAHFDHERVTEVIE